jgi:hypothetical protein
MVKVIKTGEVPIEPEKEYQCRGVVENYVMAEASSI